MRRLAALVNGLPLDSALVRSYDPDRLGRGWDSKSELLAMIAELIDQSNRFFIAANSKRGTQLPRPLYIARPDDNRRGLPQRNQKAAVRALFAKQGVPVMSRPKR